MKDNLNKLFLDKETKKHHQNIDKKVKYRITRKIFKRVTNRRNRRFKLFIKRYNEFFWL